MRRMSATQTQRAETETELAAFSPAGEALPAEPSAPSETSALDQNPQHRPSLSDSFDLENAQFGIAAIPNIPRKSTSERIRLKVRDIKSNKIARRTFKAMLAFGTIASLYQFTSLFPAFQGAHAATHGLQVQIKGETDASQSTTYGFLSQCSNLKNLPLGPDCLKYMNKTLKAPPDIDKWMMDPPAANNSTSILTARNIEPSLHRQINGSIPNATSKAEQVPTIKTLWAVTFINGFFPLFVLLYILQFGVDGLWELISRLDRHIKAAFGIKVFGTIGKMFEARIGRKRIVYLIIYTTVCYLLFDIYVASWLWNSQYLLESWSATSDFLESCKMQQSLDLPLGEDCLKYMAKGLKPSPVYTTSRFAVSIAFWVIGMLPMLVGILGVLSLVITAITAVWQRGIGHQITLHPPLSYL